MKNNMLRGKILRLLSDMYPDGIEKTSLNGIYHAYETIEDIERSVEYLCDKGYCNKTQSPHPYKSNMTITYYKITPSGLDLIDGNIAPDSGIVIPLEA